MTIREERFVDQIAEVVTALGQSDLADKLKQAISEFVSNPIEDEVLGGDYDFRFTGGEEDDEGRS